MWDLCFFDKSRTFLCFLDFLGAKNQISCKKWFFEKKKGIFP